MNAITVSPPRQGALAFPPPAPLAMPVRPFDHAPPPPSCPPSSPPNIDARRTMLLAVAALLTILASAQLTGIAARDGIDVRDICMLLVFCPLFGWIALAFTAALAGFLCLAAGGGAASIVLPPPGRPSSRVAILIPVHNEDTAAIFGRLQRMARSLAQTGYGGDFAFYLLSDTTSEPIAREELTAWRRLGREIAGIPIHYRRRRANIGRKPGNIADWVARHGGAYDAMIVLDADSMMSGEAMVRLTLALERAPDVALIQTIPGIAEGRTAFARWQQFAARLYGPVSSAGLTWWSGAEASFWGHNAIVRTAAFAAHCGLPRLRGRGPLAGDILSHDMVESALLRRAGWAVHMVWLDRGSFETFPPTPIDHAVRDRRWCQGNLQHLRLLTTPGLHWVSRLQLLMGASTYLTSPLWLLLLIVALSNPDGAGGLGLWDAGDEPSTWMFSVTILLLIGPKLMGLLWALASPERRNGFGGTRAILAGVAADIAMGLIFAPMVMVSQSLMLCDILRGRSSGWAAQRRDVDGIGWREAWARYRIHVLLGLPVTLGLFLAPHAPLALAPIALGLILAPAIAVVTSSGRLGNRLAAAGLFVTREERLSQAPAESPASVPFPAPSLGTPTVWSPAA